MPDQPDPRFTNVTGLGQLRALHEQNLLKYYFWLTLAGVPLVFSLAGVAIGEPALGWLVFPAGAGFILALTFFVLHRRRAAALFDSGLAYYDGKLTWQADWADITRVETVVEYDSEMPSSRSYFVTLPGGRRQLPGSLQRIAELWSHICLESSLAAIRSGRPLNIGPFIVDQDGLSFAGHEPDLAIQWNDVREFKTKWGFLQSRVEVADSHGARSLKMPGTAHGAYFPDLGSFTRVCEALIALARSKNGQEPARR